MFRALKGFWLALLMLLMGGQSIYGFSLIGPLNAEPWQIQSIGYNLNPPDVVISDVGTPRNLGEEYRWNTPNVYYAFDATFLDYFGSNGVAAVDAAFAVMNSLTNVSSYTPDLSEWPTTAGRVNFRAKALGLVDIKSTTMSLLLEQLGLGQPDRWTWTLHTRFIPAGAVCPNYTYLVVQRNFDPASYTYSTLVNGTLFGYQIFDTCVLNPNNNLLPLDADAVEYTADTSAPSFASVAAGMSGFAVDGWYFTGLTRDDVGGLRYLMAKTNLNVEAVDSNSLLISTTNSQSLITTSNLTTFTAQTRTNNPIALLGLYPNLQILSFTPSFSNAVTTNVSAFFTNLTGSVAGSPPTAVLVTNFTTNAVTNFDYAFGNVITNQLFSRGFVTVQITNVVPKPGGFPGQLQTNISSTTTLTPFINGDFFIIPSNQCGFSIVSTQLTTLTTITNTIITATNAPGVTNANGQFFVENIITYFTNHTLIVSIPQCVPNSVSLRQGIEKMHFFRQDFDSLLGQVWTPVTNIYTLTAVSNNVPLVQTFYRVINRPDILFSAADLASGPAAPPGVEEVRRSTPGYNTGSALPGLAGPGTIQSPVHFTFNKVGPAFSNPGTSFVLPRNDTSHSQLFQWGSYDGTTNEPVVYPSSTSVANLENQVFLQIVNSGPLASGIVNSAYAAQLEATGVQPPPYTWSVASNSPGLPNGLNLSADTGVITGVPTTSGVFDFIVQVADTTGRFSQRNFTIEVDP